MAISVLSSGTQTAVLTTEHTLVTTTVGGAYELHVDMFAKQAGETLLLRLKDTILSGGAERSAVYYTHTGAAAEVAPNGYIVILGPFAFDRGTTATLTQTGGTGRAYPWKVLRVGS